jgi:predicted ABC-type transport system involved in lysophospholipase L1 biosynthesis ATPase subunit
MKIIQFTAENVKKLRAVEITPKGEIVTIAGRNGAGKTSVLDAIFWAIAGTAAIQGQPIRKGETKARIRLDLGEFVVERRFTEKGSTLVVEDVKGQRVASPQKVLDAIFGELCFDPLAFTREDARKQYDTLRRIADLQVDIDALEALNQSDYAKRTDINRDAKAKRATADAMTVPPGLPDAPVDEEAILTRLSEVGQRNGERTMRIARRTDTARKIQTLKDSIPGHERVIADLEAQIAAQRQHIETARTEAAKLQAQLDGAPALPAEVDASEIRAELDRAKLVNAGIVRRTERARVFAEAEALEAQSLALTESIDARAKAKQDAIGAAKMPVPGLGFGDGVVTYNGVPFDQASTAEQIRVSMAIAMAANPKLRVIRVQDGSLLDEDSLALIASEAKERDYQVWIETVRVDSKVGIVIEDGSVIAVDGAPAKAKAA